MKDDVDYDSLLDSIPRSRLTLAFPRAQRRDITYQIAGNHYAENGALKDIPVNLLSMYQTIIGRSLIGKVPRFLLSTYNMKQKPAVKAVQEYGNRELVKMRFADTMQRVVVDALACIGIVKVALAKPENAASKAWRLHAGKAFVERVDLDDFVYDVHGRDFGDLGYIGHRYRVPLASVKKEDFYSKLGRKNLRASLDVPNNTEGDERPKQLGQGNYSNQHEFEEMVDLWEIYLPRHRLVCTFVSEDGGNPTLCQDGKPLGAQPWVGHDDGPYVHLGMGIVSGNAMPKAPMMDLLDLHLNANEAYRKVLRMCARIKEITCIAGSADADATRMNDASDGQTIRIDQPDKIKQIVMSGNAIQTVLAVADQCKLLFNSVGGNLELIGGREQQAKTATQERLLNENAGGGTEDMRDRTTVFVSDVIERLFWYWWRDPFAVQKAPHSLQSTPELSATRKVFPANHPNKNRLRRVGPQPEINVDPYSLPPSTPQSRVNDIDEMVMKIVLPMMPLLQQQGISFDMGEYLRIRGEYKDMPDLERLLAIAAPPQQNNESSPGQPPGMPAQTERTYNRVSVPGRSQKGDERNRINALLGINPGGGPETAKQQPNMMRPMTNGAR